MEDLVATTITAVTGTVTTTLSSTLPGIFAVFAGLVGLGLAVGFLLKLLLQDDGIWSDVGSSVTSKKRYIRTKDGGLWDSWGS